MYWLLPSVHHSIRIFRLWKACQMVMNQLSLVKYSRHFIHWCTKAKMSNLLLFLKSLRRRKKLRKRSRSIENSSQKDIMQHMTKMCQMYTLTRMTWSFVRHLAHHFVKQVRKPRIQKQIILPSLEHSDSLCNA